MFILGHVGITAAAVRAVDRETDLGLPMLFSILPDLIDKPLFLLAPALANGSTRNVGHSLAGAAAVLAILLALRPRIGRPALLWACYAGHLLLDRLWLVDGPVVFFWPLLGRFPHWSPKTPHLLAYNLAGEAIGLAFLLGLLRTRFASGRRSRPESDICGGGSRDRASS
jgi:hypothetical protein